MVLGLLLALQKEQPMVVPLDVILYSEYDLSSPLVFHKIKSIQCTSRISLAHLLETNQDQKMIPYTRLFSHFESIHLPQDRLQRGSFHLPLQEERNKPRHTLPDQRVLKYPTHIKHLYMRQDRIRKAKPLLIPSDIPSIVPLVLRQV